MKTEDGGTGLDYGGGKISSLFFKIFIPTLLGMIFNALLTIIDGIFVGQGVGPDGIAAVNIVAPIYMIITGSALMFGIGASVTAGIALSTKNYGRANSIVTTAFVAATVLAVLIVAGALFFTDGVVALLGSTERLDYHTTGYLLYLLPGMIPMMWECIGMMVIRLDGSPKYAMMCNVVPALLNIVLDWWMVFPLGMGVRGAALATAISCIVGGVMAVMYFRWSYVIKFTRRLAGFGSSVLTQIQIGSAAFVTELAMSVMMFTGNYVFLNRFGESGVAAYSIACYLFPLIFMINNAVAQSAQPIISYNYGAGNRLRVVRAFKVSLAVGIVCGLVAATGIAACARGIVTLFIAPDSEAGRHAIAGLPIFSIASVFFALNIACIGYYQSIKKAVTALVLTLLRGVVFLVPLFLVLSRIFPDRGMWAAIPASEALTFLIIVPGLLSAIRR